LKSFSINLLFYEKYEKKVKKLGIVDKSDAKSGYN